MTKFITDPVTGRIKTVGHDDGGTHSAKQDIARDRLAEQRRQLREMLAGNTQFHEDPFAEPKPAPVDIDLGGWERLDIYG